MTPIQETAGIEPARGRSVRPLRRGAPGRSSRRRRAIRAMSILEQECGITPAQHDAFHAEQRANVFKRYGIKP